tara:strand:- start:42 stop:224 length:183 start_codon:yes stop_codon:yes gene_type:complete
MDENTYLQNNKLCRLLDFSKHNLPSQIARGHESFLVISGLLDALARPERWWSPVRSFRDP